jgi:hypothetical protein
MAAAARAIVQDASGSERAAGARRRVDPPGKLDDALGFAKRLAETVHAGQGEDFEQVLRVVLGDHPEEPMALYIHVVLSSPSRPYKLVPYATTVHTSMSGNLHFPDPDPPLTLLAAKTQTLVISSRAARPTRRRGP